MRRESQPFERLDDIHVCKECSTSFLFDSEITDHQAVTGHSGVYEISFSSTDEPEA
jgi:hypothetical protein